MNGRGQYIDLGGERVVRADRLIGVFDIDNTTVSRHTRDFLNGREKAGQVENLASDIPVSFIMCADPVRTYTSRKTPDCEVYLSQYAPRSMGGRQIVKKNV